ncbi:MAG TPA: hypothetical protein VFV27_10750 [Nevskiaceae bacterium]|nr:hypothetical protein [Nevskiaceae bacterium]
MTAWMPLPANLHLPDRCHRLTLPAEARLDPAALPAEGDLLVVELQPEAAPAPLQLASGRLTTLYPGDRVLALTGRHFSSLGQRCAVARRGESLHLLGRDGLVGAEARGGGLTAVRLLGRVCDGQGQPLRLPELAASTGRAPATVLGVVSAARGARAGTTLMQLLRGLAQLGLDSAVARPLGLIDGGERWALIEAGAREVVDAADVGCLDGEHDSGDCLRGRAQRQLAALAASGAPIGLLRLAGGLGLPALRRLLLEPGAAALSQGLVVCASDALCAVEAVRQLRAVGHPVLAVSGAITRSPLARREAEAELDLPVLAASELAAPSTLSILLGDLPEWRSPPQRLAA